MRLQLESGRQFGKLFLHRQALQEHLERWWVFWMLPCKTKTLQSFFKWAKHVPFFYLFSFLSQCKDKYDTHLPINDKSIGRWWAWDSIPGWQDGRRRRIHWAMAAPQNSQLFFYKNRPTPASFSFIFGLLKQTIQFLQQINVKNDISYSPGIWTHNLSDMSCLT